MYICVLMLMTIYECKFVFVHILALVFLSLIIVLLIAWFYKYKNNKTVYRGFLEYVVNARSSWFSMKVYPLGTIDLFPL